MVFASLRLLKNQPAPAPQKRVLLLRVCMFSPAFFFLCVLELRYSHVYVHSPGGQGKVSVSVRAHVDSIKVLEGEERRRDQGEETRVELIHTPPTRLRTFSADARVKLDFPAPDWNSKRSLSGTRK